MIAEYKDADDDIVRWQSADGTVKTAHINDLILAYEQKKGKWVYDKGLYRCTACNDLLTVAGWDIPEKVIYTNFKFCPNCGAKMERNEDETN